MNDDDRKQYTNITQINDIFNNQKIVGTQNNLKSSLIQIKWLCK